MAVAASLWPLIIVFEAGHGVVTRYAGVDIVAEVLS
jgi:isocitrate dehydrogenase